MLAVKFRGFLVFARPQKRAPRRVRASVAAFGLVVADDFASLRRAQPSMKPEEIYQRPDAELRPSLRKLAPSVSASADCPCRNFGSDSSVYV
jgi:hypothetical protein